MYVCLCKAITESQIRQAIDQGACTITCLRRTLGVASKCCKCSKQAKKMLRHSQEVSFAAAAR